MHLKKVEVCGFKSFADRTVLDFEPGISGIVGPNGCGKSNISDSIRWCLGEQKAKSMRSSNMQEVIFGGTQTRTTTGMAEVSLTFDNSQNGLPVDYSEVIITRRLFRSGESEYFINKTQCRLKDIRGMFLDTGIGYDGYSIIEQGKVDFLTTAKPEDRRELFEEAAGIAKYKVKREETLRRLEKIDTDMSRLSDALVIHKQQIADLNSAAKKAKQYKEYKENLAKYEIVSLVRHITCGIGEIERIKKNLDPKVKEFESDNVFIAQLDVEIQDMRFSLDGRNEQYVNINRDLSEIKTQIGVADQIIQHAMSREIEIKAEQERLGHELVTIRDKVVQMEEQLKTLNTDDGSLSVEVVCLENVFKEKELQYNSIKVGLLELESKENEVRSRISELKSEKEQQLKLKTELAEIKTRLDADIISLERMITMLENDVESANREIAEIDAELTTADKSRWLFESENEKINKTVSENEEKIKTLENSLLQYKETLVSGEARIATLKEFDQQDPVRSSIRAVLSLGNVARGPVSSLIDVNDDKIGLIASALGEKLNYLVCETSERVERAIKFLEDNGLCRLSFIVAEKISDSYRKSDIGLPLGYVELIKYFRYNPEDEKIIRFLCSYTLVCGNKIYGNVIVQGGGKISFEKPMLIEEQIKKLQKKSDEIRRSISSVQSEIEQIREYQINSRLEKERLGFDTIKIKTQIEEKHSRIEEKKNGLKRIAGEINRHKEEINSKKTELASFSRKIFGFETKLANYENEEDKLYEELKTVDNGIFSVRKEEELIAPLMMSARSSWDKKAAELENMRRGQQYILDNISNIKQQIVYAENRIRENSEKLLELLATQETEAVKMHQLYEQQTQKEAEMRISLTDKQTLQDALDAKIKEWRGLCGKVDGLNSEIKNMQSDIKNFEYQKNNLKKRLAETYSKNYEDIKNDFEGVDEANSEEIAEIKRKMESLGAVNLAAQEEYDALEKRYSFLLMQQQDLLEAKDDLYEVIKKINRVTVENFKMTFDIVKGNFKEIYRKLFGGGEADLMLTDENDLLESGVDIYAQPPGKKLQNISLCSGGEKALTGVALLFAFFVVKPSPFCILDEVDAPLDDANVGRYNAMVKEFSAQTQFLIVTHNRRTMEMADVLYGVTMEEQGISKIISVKMNKQNDAVTQ
ncbi:chromosome partition protein Smc [Endomicrobiia bacterium]|nr:chromosome partition protein Smc [Endomicrobiia bacterium]